MWDVLSIVVLAKVGEDYRGTVTYTEAKYQIFMKCLDLPEKLFHKIKIQFGKGPTITFKLTKQVDVDYLPDVERL